MWISSSILEAHTNLSPHPTPTQSSAKGGFWFRRMISDWFALRSDALYPREVFVLPILQAATVPHRGDRDAVRYNNNLLS